MNKVLNFGVDYIDYTGEYTSIRKGGYIPWGIDNLYPQFIYKLRSMSTMHGRIIESKKQMIGGAGWDMSLINSDIFKNGDSKDDMNDILLKISESIADIGGVFIKVFWSLDRKSVSKVEVLPYQNVRIVLPDDENPTPDKIKWFLVSDDWDNVTKFRPRKYHIYDVDNNIENPVQIYYWKGNGIKFYPEPTWIAAKESIILEDKLDRYHLKSVMNGFHLGKFITFPYNGRNISDEEKESIVKNLRRELEGEENANKNFIWLAEDKEHIPDFKDLSSQNVDNSKFITLQNERVTQAIMTAHGVTNPSLFAIKTPGSLGSSKELIDSLNIFQSIVIGPIQLVIENIMSYLIPQTTWSILQFKIYENVQVDIVGILSSTLPIEQKRIILEMGGIDPVYIKKLLPNNE